MTPYEQRFRALSAWARREMALLGPKVTQEKQIGQLWLIADELMRRLAKAETDPGAIGERAQRGEDNSDQRRDGDVEASTRRIGSLLPALDPLPPQDDRIEPVRQQDKDQP